MGFFTHSTKPSDDLVQNGIHGTATVEHARMAGMMVESSGFMRQKKVEDLLTGDTSMTKYKLDLQVQLPGREPYSASVTLPVPMMKVRYMSGGAVLPVLVDPGKDDHIAIDWDGEFTQGTLAEMADANPLIAAAMKGAGVDIDRITAMQSAAIAAGQTPSNVIIGGQMLGTPAPAAAAPDPLDQLKRLGELHASGVLTDDEFAAQKAKILAE